MAINNTMTLIGNSLVGAGGASYIEFTSIPQTYTDLMLVCSTRHSTTGTVANYVDISLNGSTSSITGVYLIGTGASIASGTGQKAGLDSGAGATANTFSNNTYYFANYTSNTNKQWSAFASADNFATEGYETAVSGLWSNTAAISSIRLTPQTGTLVQYSTAYLYGINSVAPLAKATGGLITQDDTYIYHTFLSSGLFTPTESLNCEMLIVAGGGGCSAASGASGGSGAGGLLYGPITVATATSHTVTIGAGGAGSTSVNGGASRGGDSSISGGSLGTPTANGGGTGSFNSNNGLSGGSGGGAGGYSGNGSNRPNTAATQGNYSTLTGYGNTGGSATSSSNGAYSGSGGGGAGAVGGNCNNGSTLGFSATGQGGAGGIGRQYSDFANATGTGHNGYYAGGGGGGYESDYVPVAQGGLGGGGNGASNRQPATAGLANTGGGAGGSAGNFTSLNTNGGSGILIVRYAK